MKNTKFISTALISTLALAMVAPQATLAAGNELAGKGKITYKEDTSPVQPVDPENPDKEVDVDTEEGTQNPDGGNLTVDFISTLKFDVQNITVNQGEYFALPTTVKDEGIDVERGNYVQVTDKRSLVANTPAGWTLSAKLTKQFENADGGKLNGATISYSNAFANTKLAATKLADPTAFVLNETDSVPAILTAATGEGWGTHTVEFGRPAQDGEEATMGNSVKLTVPANTPLSASEYNAEITWTIAELN